MNVNSPGFTSRVVDKATESASYHIKYPAVRQIPAYRFDKSTLRQLSKIPKANFAGAVRIAPPELKKYVIFVICHYSLLRIRIKCLP